MSSVKLNINELYSNAVSCMYLIDRCIYSVGIYTHNSYLSYKLLTDM